MTKSHFNSVSLLFLILQKEEGTVFLLYYYIILYRHLGARGTLREGIRPSPFGQKKINNGHKENIKKHGLAHFFVKATVARHETAPPRCHPILKSYIHHCGARCISTLALSTNRVMYQSSHPQTSISLFSIIFDSMLPTEIMHFQLVVREQHHRSTTGP